MRVEYRPAIASDVDALAALEAEAFVADRISHRSFRRFVDSPSASLVVARAGSSLAGYCLVLFRRGSVNARLYSIAVASGREGAGIGSKLLAEAIALAARRGASALTLEVRPDNDRARAIYEKRGFSVARTIPDYYADGSDALRMSLSVGRSHGAVAPLHARGTAP